MSDPLQLSFDVVPSGVVSPKRPDLACVSISGALRIRRDLNPGDEVTVTVASSAGQVIAAGTYEVGGLAFRALKDGSATFGYERQHKTKLRDDQDPEAPDEWTALLGDDAA
ncbi:MAG: hypothetical protein QM679_10115 [Patulibacter sp.]